MSEPWPMVPLGEGAERVERPVAVQAGRSYRTMGVRLGGEGEYERETIDGADTAAKSLSVVRRNDLVINKIWVRNGSVAVVPDAVDGCVGSGEFPTFGLAEARINSRW